MRVAGVDFAQLTVQGILVPGDSLARSGGGADRKIPVCEAGGLLGLGGAEGFLCGDQFTSGGRLVGGHHACPQLQNRSLQHLQVQSATG